MNLRLTSLMLALALTASTEAFAGQRWAPVVQVVPITEQVRVEREVCREVATTRYTRSGNDKTGLVVGALVGGALGNQVGKGDGRKAATVAGAVIGGVIGNEAEKDQRSRPRFEIFVQMDDGRRLVVEQPTLDGLREGDYVQIVGNRARLF